MTEHFEKVKQNIEESYLSFQRNYQRFSYFKRMIAETTISDNQRAFLATLGKPNVEFNLLAAQVNQLMGEFAKLDPDIVVSQRPNAMQPVPPEVVKLAEAHLSYITHDAAKNSVGKSIYKDVISGGWGVGRIYTDYIHPFSNRQGIFIRRCNPLMCGFDPLATEPHKGDGRYSFEVYSMDMETAKSRYPNEDIESIAAAPHVGSFQWVQSDVRGKKYVVICEYFEKRKKRTRIVELSDGRVIRENEYKKMLKEWDSFAVPPIVIGEPRWTTYDEIWRLEICNKKILKESKTDWSYLPHIFFDGDSDVLSEQTSGAFYQFTKPVIYHLVGVQDLKNASGQALLNSLENMVQSKFVVKKEAIPQEQDYQDSITNIQRVGTVVVNAYSENNPDKPIPEPIRELTQTPAPPEVMGAFSASDQTAQTIMGGFTSNLGKQSNDLSGKAILEAAAIDGLATIPYLDGYLKGWEWCGCIILDLLPKYIVGEQQLPVRLPDGQVKSVEINKDGKTFDYKPYSLDLVVKSAFSSEVQQSKSIQQIIGMAQAMPKFAEFMNSDVGMPVLIRNMTIKDSDELLEGFKQWSQQMAQMQQQQAQQPNPEMLIGQAELIKAEAAKARNEIEGMWRSARAEIDAAKVAIEQQRVDNETIEAQAKVEDDVIKSALAREKDKADIVGQNLENAKKMIEVNVEGIT